MAKVLIIGANSFVGSNFRNFSRFKDIEEISLYDISPEEIDFGKYDVVLHLAAIVHQSRKITDHDYFLINRDLCKRVAKQAKKNGVKQFIFLSTIKVYGKPISEADPWTEDSVCYPEDSYGISKFGAELALRKLEDSDFIVSIIRTPIIYGPGVKANMLKFIKLIERFPILPFAGVNNNRHYTYVENLVGFIDRIIEIKVSGTFIVMDDTPFSTTELVLTLSNLLHKRLILFKLPDLFVKAGNYIYSGYFDRLYRSSYLDNSKTKEILNYKPTFSTEEGLKRTISFYLKNKELKR
jgi:nucleoside-diphosphate-sugar epimerase